MNSEPTDRLLTPAQTAERLAVSVGTLGVWRCTRRYPLDYIKLGRAVRYRSSDVERFISQNTVGATD